MNQFLVPALKKRILEQDPNNSVFYLCECRRVKGFECPLSSRHISHGDALYGLSHRIYYMSQ